jgi:hypothetical protein
MRTREAAKPLTSAFLLACLSVLASAAAAESALETWNKIKDRGSCDDFRAFVAAHGDTPLAAMALRKVEDCDGQDKRARAEEWRRIKDAGTCSGFSDFLSRHPDAPEAADARTEVARCEAEQAKAAEESRRNAEIEARAREEREAKNREPKNREPEHREAPTTGQAEQHPKCWYGFWTAEQLAASFGDHTWEGRAGSTRWQELYAADGSVRGRAWKNGQRRPNYAGRWYLEGDRYCYCTAECRSFACRRVRQIGCETWTWDIEEGKKRSQVMEVHDGNPLGL